MCQNAKIKTAKIKQFINVKKESDCYEVDSVLNIKNIDEASIKRTMIRQYKRLHMGRHEYGEAVKFNLEE